MLFLLSWETVVTPSPGQSWRSGCSFTSYLPERDEDVQQVTAWSHCTFSGCQKCQVRSQTGFTSSDLCPWRRISRVLWMHSTALFRGGKLELGLAVISEGDERFSPRPPCSSRTRQPKRPAVCSQNQTPNSQLLPSCQIMNSLDATVEGD